MKTPAIALAAVLLFASPALADASSPSLAEEQFAKIVSWEGRWTVAETDALEIVFESTARGKTMVERWETAAGLHSITVYHVNGEHVVATHYCPQGNQPRLASVTGDETKIAFAFRDITGLDAGESHTHTLAFEPQADGSLLRTEVYTGADGPGAPSSYTLKREPS